MGHLFCLQVLVDKLDLVTLNLNLVIHMDEYNHVNLGKLELVALKNQDLMLSLQILQSFDQRHQQI
jgi:hypothetical protein